MANRAAPDLGEDGSPTRLRANKVYRHVIVPAVEECGHTVVRADEEQRPDVIGVKTINHLFGNDLNGDNPNVFHRSTRSRIGTDGGMPARAGPGRSSAAQAHGHPHRFGARRGRSSLVRRGTTGSASTWTEHPRCFRNRRLPRLPEVMTRVALPDDGQGVAYASQMPGTATVWNKWGMVVALSG